MSDTAPAPSALEGIKESSQQLRGTIATQLQQAADHFDRDTVQLLKHHGMYQQDDRDARSKTPGSERRHSFLVRTRVPGGRLTSQQLLAELALCDEVGNGTLRITSRQGLQLHGVLKTSLAAVLRRINAVDLTTLGACGDVNRNVMGCPAPACSRWDGQLADLTLAIAKHFAPRTAAYREIWLQDPETLDKQRVALDNGTEEPLYGRVYLPRKFKIGVAFPWDNCIDVHTHDLGLVAITQDEQIIGFNALVGGGMGMTPAKKNTFPALGKALAFVPVSDAIDLAEAIVKAQRDHGNRSDRKQARLKYLIHHWGLEAFRAKVVEYFGRDLEPPRAAPITATCHHLGWHEQDNGHWYYGLNIENGRILDTDSMQLKTALREICRQLQTGIRLTAYQKLLFTDIDEQNRPKLESLLRDHGVPLTEEVSELRRWAMACVAWPTCGLAITESERALPGILDQLEAVLDRLGLARDELTVRMTGCPNGCVRPYNADIGLVGRARNQYTIYLGGNLRGTNLCQVYCDRVPVDELVATLEPVFVQFQQRRNDGESFGDFCQRVGIDTLRAMAEDGNG